MHSVVVAVGVVDGLRREATFLLDCGAVVPAGGSAHFADLVQLRSLTIEDSAITDAGLMHLKSLTNLEQLNVKGTKVTQAGISDLRRALPKLDVRR